MSAISWAESRAANWMRSRRAWDGCTPVALPVSNNVRKPLCLKDLITPIMYRIAQHATLRLAIGCIATGALKRSGKFKAGDPMDDWTTYDTTGQLHKSTREG